MKARLREATELMMMAKYLNEKYNTKGHQYVSLALASYPRIVTLQEGLGRYFLERKWLMKNENDYRKFKGERFCEYFNL